MMRFGSEQKFVQNRSLLDFLYGTLGEFRFPMRFRAQMLCRLLPKDFQPATIWDAGCGEGHTTFMLSRLFPEARITGTDLNMINIERCRRIAKHARTSNLVFLQRDLAQHSVGGDLVICFEVLEHIENYREALKNLTATLRPGGFLVIHTPADTIYQSETWGLRRFMKDGHDDHVNHADGHDHVRPGFELAQLKEEIAQIITFIPLLSVASIEELLPIRTGGGILIVAQNISQPAA
jgi:SAM-dependent methyltransferase